MDSVAVESRTREVTGGVEPDQVEYPQDKFIYQLFEAQVARNPDVVAVVFEDQQLTYGEWNKQQLAHHLRSLGGTRGTGGHLRSL